MRRFRLVVTPVTMLAVGLVGGASAYAGALAVAKPVPTLTVVCVPPTGARTLTAPIRGKCAKGTVLHRLPPGARGPVGATGATGPAGPTGASGPAGKNGTNGTNGKDGKDGATKVSVVTNTQVVGSNTDYTFTAYCASGSSATGGGFVGVLAATAKVVSSAPKFGADLRPIGWDVRIYNSGATNIAASAYAVCAAP